MLEREKTDAHDEPSQRGSPLLRELLESWLRGLDAADGPRFVRQTLFADPASTLDTLAALPEIFNLTVRALTELGEQIQDKSTPRLTTELLHDLIDKIDLRALGACAEVWTPLIREIWRGSPELRDSFLEKMARASGAAAAGALNGAARRVAGRSPASSHFETFISELARRLDRPALEEASLAAASRLLDSKTDLLAWSAKLLRRRLDRPGNR